MEEPAVSIHWFPLLEDMMCRDDEEHQDPCLCLHNHLSDVSVYCERLRMPSIDANPPVGADGVLYDGIMLHRHNPTFLRTFDCDSAKVVPRFKGRLTSIGVPSQVSFYDRKNEREYRFGFIDMVDIGSLSDDKLSQYQKICFPPEHGMEYFVDARRAVRLSTYKWQKLPYEDIRTNIMRRITGRLTIHMPDALLPPPSPTRNALRHPRFPPPRPPPTGQA